MKEFQGFFHFVNVWMSYTHTFKMFVCMLHHHMRWSPDRVRHHLSNFSLDEEIRGNDNLPSSTEVFNCFLFTPVIPHFLLVLSQFLFHSLWNVWKLHFRSDVNNMCVLDAFRSWSFGRGYNFHSLWRRRVTQNVGTKWNLLPRTRCPL